MELRATAYDVSWKRCHFGWAVKVKEELISGNGKDVQEGRIAWTVRTRWETAWEGLYVWGMAGAQSGRRQG